MNLKMFTEDEKAILRSLPSPLKWIARDRDGWLYVYKDKPEISGDEFMCRESNTPNRFVCLALFKNIFKGVTFENSPILFREPVLDDVERRYLKQVFRPFHKQIKCVRKISYYPYECLMVDLKINGEDTSMTFPKFKENTMYRGMSRGLRYNLNELGIDYSQREEKSK